MPCEAQYSLVSNRTRDVPYIPDPFGIHFIHFLFTGFGWELL
jgi:hypothetical protein